MIKFFLNLCIERKKFCEECVDKESLEKLISRLNLDESYFEFRYKFIKSGGDVLLQRRFQILYWKDWIKSLSVSDRKSFIDGMIKNRNRNFRGIPFISSKERQRYRESFINFIVPEIYQYDSLAAFRQYFSQPEMSLDLNISDYALLRKLLNE